jgi:hypothetical protein
MPPQVTVAPEQKVLRFDGVAVVRRYRSFEPGGALWFAEIRDLTESGSVDRRCTIPERLEARLLEKEQPIVKVSTGMGG